MPTTSHAPTKDVIRPAPEATPPRQRRYWLPAAIVAIVAIVVAAVAGFLWLTGDSVAPEDVVNDSLEAFNARNLGAMGEAYHPDLVVSIDFTAVGGEVILDEEGRDLTLEQTATFWEMADPTISWEVVSATDDTVVVDQTTTFPDGVADRITSTYTVIDDIITQIDHVVLEVG